LWRLGAFQNLLVPVHPQAALQASLYILSPAWPHFIDRHEFGGFQLFEGSNVPSAVLEFLIFLCPVGKVIEWVVISAAIAEIF
jgi:hypothetical protein